MPVSPRSGKKLCNRNVIKRRYRLLIRESPPHIAAPALSAFWGLLINTDPRKKEAQYLKHAGIHKVSVFWCKPAVGKEYRTYRFISRQRVLVPGGLLPFEKRASQLQVRSNYQDNRSGCGFYLTTQGAFSLFAEATIWHLRGSQNYDG